MYFKVKDSINILDELILNGTNFQIKAVNGRPKSTKEMENISCRFANDEKFPPSLEISGPLGIDQRNHHQQQQKGSIIVSQLQQSVEFSATVAENGCSPPPPEKPPREDENTLQGPFPPYQHPHPHHHQGQQSTDGFSVDSFYSVLPSPPPSSHLPVPADADGGKEFSVPVQVEVPIPFLSFLPFLV